MHKLINKVIAALVIVMMTGINFLSVGVYAANEINQNADTKEDNVKFNATINGEYEVELDISEEALLELSVSVKEAGYLKDIKVTLEGNNYSLGEITDENVKYVEGNELELNEVNTGEDLNINLPIKFNKQETVSEEEFNKDSEVKLQATYVNEKGKEKKIEKSLTETVIWRTEGTEEISQDLIRYIKYENKTMVSFDIKEGIQENVIPVKNKEISVIVPKIEGKDPAKAIVTGNNIDYKYENGILTIGKDTTAEDGKYSWNSQDTYGITYIYEAQTNSETIATTATAKVTTINNVEKEGTTQNNEFEIVNEIGSLVEVKADGTSELNKGYMYTNINRAENKLDTTYSTNYQINVGYAEVLDKVEVTEISSNFEDTEGNALKDANESVKVSKVSVNKEELTALLGENGNVIVKDENGNVLVTLNKDATEAELNTNKISIEITKPEQEGILNVKVEKAIKGDGANSKEEINSFKKLKTTIESKGYTAEQEISNSEVSQEIELTEPTSKASLDVSSDRLSTVVKNENVVFNVVLNKNDISDALYTNPTIKVKLPSQITGIEVLSGNLLYEDEIKPGVSEVSGNEIIIRLEGTQTQYNTSTTTDGALIRIETNLTLDNLVPSSEEKVQLEYSNEATGEVNTIEKGINIIAPSGFVTTNTIKVDESEATAIENDAELIKLKTKQPAKTMEISANLINNIDADAEGFVVLGRLPFAGNKTVGGVDLGSNINTTLATPIELTNLEDATVYYSTNGEETLDGQSWTLDATSDAKSFMITKEGAFENKKGASFKYTVTIPENLEYEGVAKENYGIYYNNDAQEGLARNLVESKVVGITTGSAPDIKAEISAVDTNEGYAIDEDGTVTEGEFITYRLKLTNTGSNDANNVKVTANLPATLSLVGYEDYLGEGGAGYFIDNNTKTIEREIGTLKGGESVTLNFDTEINQILSNIIQEDNNGQLVGIDETGKVIDAEEAKKIKIDFTVNSDILEENLESSYTVKNSEGNLSIKLYSNASGNYTETNQDIRFVAQVRNVNAQDKNNTTVKIKLPDGVKYKDSFSNYETSYDENTNTVTVNVGTINGLDEEKVIINAENNTQRNGTIKSQATVICDGMSEEIQSNTLELNNEILTNVIKATQTSNINGSITDKDQVEFQIDIENNSQMEQEVILEDNLPEQLRINKYTILVDGQQVEEGEGSYINSQITIPGGKKAKVVIYAEPFTSEEGTTVEIINKPLITDENNQTIDINEVSLELSGTEKAQSEETVEEGSVENSEVVEEEKTFRIVGTAWFDENKNGQRDSDETKLVGIRLKLYDSKSKEAVKDDQGNDIQATTDSNGEYSFSDIKNGEYVVIAQYNSTDYEVANYKALGVQESANSDFVETKLDGRDVVATDVIKLNDENIYGLDLGLITKDKFDLEISNNISKITVINSENERKEFNYDDDTAKIELSDEDVQNSTLLIEYNINVKNNGNVEGYAKSIVNYIPQGMAFNSELNKDWYLSKDGNLYTVSLANTKINPGESENIRLVLVKKVAEDSIGIIRGKAEIKTSYNEKGLAEINALSANKTNLAAADVIIARKTKVSAFSAISISIGLMALFTLVVYQVKKYIDKEYNIEE